MDVVKFGQQLLMKSVLEKTENGTVLPGDMGDVQSLLRDLTSNAQLTRKLNIEESAGGDARRVAEAYAELKRMRAEGSIQDTRTSIGNPMDSVPPPVATLMPGEDAQGAQLQIPEDYIDVES